MFIVFNYQRPVGSRIPLVEHLGQGYQARDTDGWLGREAQDGGDAARASRGRVDPQWVFAGRGRSLPVLPLECHLQGVQQVGDVQSLAHLVGSAEGMRSCNG